MKCEKCGDNTATVHWTEFFDGAMLDKHLCEDCQAEMLPGAFPMQNELRFQCRCGETLAWRFPHHSCGHPPGRFEKKGQTEVEISTCKCGVRFVAVTPRWVCEECGTESIVPPRETGERGYLIDHIYGTREGIEISIRGILP
jgi:protein-arginine kinase activator protein McsA